MFDAPATHQFEIGRFREETMAFPPSVTIKDYTSEMSAGLPQPEARRPARALPDDHPDRPGDGALKSRRCDSTCFATGT